LRSTSLERPVPPAAARGRASQYCGWWHRCPRESSMDLLIPLDSTVQRTRIVECRTPFQADLARANRKRLHTTGLTAAPHRRSVIASQDHNRHDPNERRWRLGIRTYFHRNCTASPPQSSWTPVPHPRHARVLSLLRCFRVTLPSVVCKVRSITSVVIQRHTPYAVGSRPSCVPFHRRARGADSPSRRPSRFKRKQCLDSFAYSLSV
jgi:hypothetical protein